MGQFQSGNTTRTALNTYIKDVVNNNVRPALYEADSRKYLKNIPLPQLKGIMRNLTHQATTKSGLL